MDKRDIYWCLSSEGLYSMATSHSGMVFSQIENRLSKYIVGKLVKLAKKRECEECIEYIKNNEQNPNQLQIAIFDLLMREYVWHMGEAVYKNKNDLKQSFRWFGAALPVLFGSVNEKRLDNYIKEMGKFFINVYKELNNFSYIILTNLLEPYYIINEIEYQKLCTLFIKGNHVQFENMKAPLGHKYEGEKLIDIILGKSREETAAYYSSHYNGYNSLSSGFKGDYPNYFFNTIPDEIIGEEDIYLY